MIDSERIDFVFEEEIRNEMADISQVNMEEMVRKYGEKKAVRLMNVIMENNVMMLKLQKQILELQVAEKKKEQRRRQEDREQRRRVYEKKWEEEEQRR